MCFVTMMMTMILTMTMTGREIRHSVELSSSCSDRSEWGPFDLSLSLLITVMMITVMTMMITLVMFMMLTTLAMMMNITDTRNNKDLLSHKFV